MSKKKHIFFSSILTLGISATLLFSVTTNNDREVLALEGTYYSSINASSGKQLLGQLHDLITKTHTTYSSYADCKNSTKVELTDAYYNGGVAEDGYITDFYSGVKLVSTWDGGVTWNREHVWCQSNTRSNPSDDSTELWGETGGGSDLHHIRPTDPAANRTRNNNRYGEVTSGKACYGNNGALNGYYETDCFEPLDNKKGDCARILFYLYTHYNSYSNSIFSGSATTNGSGTSSYFGSLSFTQNVNASSEDEAIELLLNWNTLDPVDDLETKRNEAVYEMQGNRNPFIDHPEYAAAIWGDEPLDSETVSVTSVSLNPTSATITVGDDPLQLTATVYPSNATNKNVTWKSNNTNVATVSSTGLVTAKAEGTATITVTTVDGNKTATCSIKVNAVSDPDTGGEDTPITGDVQTATYTVESTSKVNVSGTAPVGSSAVYESSYNSKYQLTKDNSMTLTLSGYDGLVVNGITLSMKSNTSSGKGSFDAKIGTKTISTIADSTFSATEWNGSWSTSYVNVTPSVTATTVGTGEDIVITISASANSLYCQSFTISYIVPESSGEEDTPTLESIVVTGQKTEFTVGDTFVFDGTVTANYSDESTLDVTNDATSSLSSDYVFTVSDVGTKTVTVTYEEISTTYTITVEAAPVEDDEETPIIGDTITASIVIADYADAHNWADATKYTSIDVDSNITATVTGGSNTGKYYTNGENWRFYQSDSGTLSFNAAEGCSISTIKITYTVSNSGVLILNSTNIASSELVSVNASEVTFVVGNTGTATNGQVKVTAIEVTYTITPAKQAQMFVDTYMHMNDVSTSNLTDTGACKGENGYYAKAKEAFVKLSNEVRKIVRENHPDAFLRLQNWAVANGETIDIDVNGEIVVSQTNSILLHFANKNKIDIYSLISLFIVGVITLSLTLYKLRKREN